MFDIGFAELLLLFIIGLLVIGPKQLPGAIRTLMRWFSLLRDNVDQLRAEIEVLDDDVGKKIKETEEDIKTSMHLDDHTSPPPDREYQRSRPDSEQPTAMDSARAQGDAEEQPPPENEDPQQHDLRK